MKRKPSYKKIITRKATLTLGISVSLAISTGVIAPGMAADTKHSVVASSSTGHLAPHTDYFNANTASPKGVQNSITNALTPKPDRTYPDTTLGRWFEKFDKERADHLPTPEDKVILARPINQQVERLAQWTAAAGRIAKTYTEFAKMLRKMDVPPGYEDLKQFKDLTAEWYEDTAQVFTDYIRPRKPAKTIEDLEDEIHEQKNHENGLVKTKAQIQSMEASIKQKYAAQLSLIGNDPNSFLKQFKEDHK
jgi:hypothetical protein